MPLFLERPWRFAFSSVLGLAIGTLVPVDPTLGADELPAEIPSVSRPRSELVGEVARSLETVENVEQRFTVLARTLFALRQLPREETQPLIELLKREAAQRDRHALFIQRSRILYILPDILLPIAKQWPDERLRDYVYRDIAGGIGDQETAKGLIAQIKAPAIQAQARKQLFDRARTLEEAKECLADLNKFGWPEHYGSKVDAYGRILAKFASDRCDEVVSYVRSELPAYEAIRALAFQAAQVAYVYKRPQTAARILKLAAELIPACTSRALATQSLLRGGYAKYYPQEAVELFDRYLAATIKGDERLSMIKGHEGVSTIASLAPAGIDVVVARAGEFAPRPFLSKPEIIGMAVRDCADSIGAEAVLEWLAKTPASPAREDAIARVAEYLDFYGQKMRERGGGEAAWVPSLLPLISPIENPGIRRQASQHAMKLAWRAPVLVPLSICDDCAKLTREYLATVHPDRLDDELQENIEFLQPTEQAEYIRRKLEKSEIQKCADLVRQSSLTNDEKKAWYEKLLVDIKNIPDRQQRASALSGIGGDLWDVAPERSLRVLWESLHLARELGLQPVAPNIDDGPGYHGWRYPPTNADEALGAARSQPSRDGQPYIDALWTFARELETGDDRDAVLEALGTQLVSQRDFPRATGIASLTNGSLRRARIYAAAAQGGKEESK